MVGEFWQMSKNKYGLSDEIYIRMIDLQNDPPGILRLLPGVGIKKAEEIVELRKSIKSSEAIIEQIGLVKHQQEWVELLEKNK